MQQILVSQHLSTHHILNPNAKEWKREKKRLRFLFFFSPRCSKVQVVSLRDANLHVSSLIHLVRSFPKLNDLFIQHVSVNELHKALALCLSDTGVFSVMINHAYTVILRCSVNVSESEVVYKKQTCSLGMNCIWGYTQCTRRLIFTCAGRTRLWWDCVLECNKKQRKLTHSETVYS